MRTARSWPPYWGKPVAEDDPFASIEDVFPASHGQAGMLFEGLARPDYPVNRAVMTARLPADLDVARFQAAWAEVIARHQSLRMRMLWEGLSAPVLVVEQEVLPAWEVLDWRGQDADALLDAKMESLRAAQFDLSLSPTTQQVLAACDDGYRFLWRLHHALMDDWSVEIAFRETAALYAGEVLPAAMPYRDFADWRAGQGEDDHWADLMAGFEGGTRLRFAEPETAGNRAHVTARREVPIEPLQQVAREMRVTLGAVLTAVWSLVVQRFSGGSDVAFGLATTERPADLPGADEAVGMFVATQPARLILEPEQSLRDVILTRQGALIAAQGRPAPELQQGMPFDTILSINESGKGGAQTLYTDVEVYNHSSLPLALVMRPGAELGLVALYSPNRFAGQDIDTLLITLASALRAVPDALDAPAMTLGVEPAEMQGEALGQAPLIPLAIAEADAGAIAVEDARGSMTYAELSARAGAYAAQLQANGVGPGDRIAVLMPRGGACIAAFLASWHIGAAYVPLDPAQPDARLQQMVEEGQVRVVLCDATLAGRLEGPVLTADPTFEGSFDPHETAAEDVAYVMFTSGSTGVPKGVVVTHGNLAASTAARPQWYGDRPERYMVVSPFGFDSSVAGIYWTLAKGGTLVVPEAETVRDIPALAEVVARHQVTHTLCLPSLYDLLLAHADKLASLRCTIVAGEAVPQGLARRHHEKRPGTRLVNEYGPTEATVWCTAADLPDEDGPVPIGAAIPGVTLSLRDAFHRPVPVGTPGELWVAGPGVATYLHGEDPAFVTEGGRRFYRTGDQVRQRADGQLVFLGRRDEQVKIGGHRIELGEVEARLQALPGVTGAAVVAVGPAEALRLVGYVTGVEAPDVASLPTAMQPAHLVTLEALPHTATGKIDRKALAARGVPMAEVAALPEGEMEQALARIWQDILGCPDLPDVTTGFFALGGTSLMAMRLVAAITEQLGQPVSLPLILGPGHTIRTLAAHLEAAPPVAEIEETSYPAPATESQKALWLAAKMRPGQPYFNLSKTVRFDRHVSRDELEAAVDLLTLRHEILGCTLALANRQLTLTPIEVRPGIDIEPAPGALDPWLAEQAERPFVMDGGPLWRIAAAVDEQTTVITLCIHHTISDGWSLDVIMQDLVAVLSGSDLAAQTRSFAALQPPRDATEDVQVWDRMLEGAPFGPRLPTDRALPERSAPEGVLAQGSVTEAALDGVLHRAKAAQSTPFAVLWAATALWLQRETGAADSVMAVSHAGRSQPGFDRTVGCFTYALPYRLDLTDCPDLTAATAKAAGIAAKALAHEDVAVTSLSLPAGGTPRGYLSSFSPIALQFNDFDWSEGVTVPGVEAIDVTPTLTSYFEVSIEWAIRRGVLHCAVLARADLYDPATVEGWIDRLTRFVEDHVV